MLRPWFEPCPLSNAKECSAPYLENDIKVATTPTYDGVDVMLALIHSVYGYCFHR